MATTLSGMCWKIFHIKATNDNDVCVCVCVCVHRYLEYVRIPHTEPVEHEFRWGQRAEIEVSKARILEFMGEVSICCW